MHALGGGRVDFDPVAEAEQALGAVPVPDQGVERGEQRLPFDAPRAARFGMEKGGLAPAFDLDGEQCPVLDQGYDRGPALLDAEAEIVAQVGRGRDSEGAGGEGDEAAPGLGLVRGRQGEDGGGG